MTQKQYFTLLFYTPVGTTPAAGFKPTRASTVPKHMNLI